VPAAADSNTEQVNPRHDIDDLAVGHRQHPRVAGQEQAKASRGAWPLELRQRLPMMSLTCTIGRIALVVQDAH